MEVRARLLLLLLLQCQILRCQHDRVTISNVFWIRVKIDGSKADYEKLVLDTGSPFTWLYNYRILEEAHGAVVGGYGTTAINTLVTAPQGGNVIIYADNDRVECDKWIERYFTLHGLKWTEPFGVANYVVQRAKKPIYTGLLGASRDSNFIRHVQVFGFKPVSRQEAEMFYNPIRSEWCHNNQVMYFPLSSRNRHFSRHWASDTVVTFGDTKYDDGFILDTGASVIALPSGAFRDFMKELEARNVKFKYSQDKLSGVIFCNQVHLMPSWYIGDKDGHHGFRVTPTAYVFERAGTELCVVDVAKVSAGHPIIFGLPVLRSAISEFNQQNNTIGLCIPRSIDRKLVDKPLTSPRGELPIYPTEYPWSDDFFWNPKSSNAPFQVEIWPSIFAILRFILTAV